MSDKKDRPDEIDLDRIMVIPEKKKENAISAGERRRRQTHATVLSALFSALSVIILWVGYLTNIADLTSVIFAATLALVAGLESGRRYSLAVAAVTTSLSLILLPDKLLAIIYLIFGGLYPSLKPIFERAGLIFGWMLKLLYGNTMLTGVIWLASYVFMLPADEYGFSILIYVLGNMIFICGDLYMSLLTANYVRRLRPRFMRIFKR